MQQYQQAGPWGSGSGLPPQPPRRRNPLVVVLVAIVAAIIALAAVLVVLNLTRPGGGKTQDTGYKNEQYQVPDPTKTPPELPEPSDDAQAKQWTEQNAFYQQQLTIPVRCELPTIDLVNATDKELEQHFNDQVACLMRSWITPVEAAKYQLPRPSVTVYTSAITTKCGKLPMKNAVYCGGDQQIYYARDVYTVVPPEVQGKRWTVESIIAHEFGHALQGRTGILISKMMLQDSQDKQGQLLLSRRNELQADCFAGAFLASIKRSANITDADFAAIKTMFNAFGDDELSGNPSIVGNHGRGASRQAWAQKGFSATSVSSCNTYSAPESDVQ